MRHISNAERRARLARRHRLAPGDRAGDCVEAARSMVCLHATTPSSVYLSAWARVPGFTVGAMDKALYVDRTLVKQLAMRRTLFAFPIDLLGAAQAGASRRVAEAEARRLARDVERAGLRRDGAAWLDAAKQAVLDALADGRELTSTELRADTSLLEGAISYGEGKAWGGKVPVGPRVLTVLSAEGRIVRASNDGGWAVSRPRWASMATWLGAPLPDVAPEDGTAALARAWLATFGPGTVQDLKWWLGGTLGVTRRALADVGAVEVRTDQGVGYVLPDDVDPAPPVEPWAALLPELDPTTMGWQGRDWYLGEHRPHVFDSNGNGGNTAWWRGRIVGAWHQDDGGRVRVELLEEVGRDGRRALDAEADRLSEWLDQTRVPGRYPSPAVKRAVSARGAAAT